MLSCCRTWGWTASTPSMSVTTPSCARCEHAHASPLSGVQRLYRMMDGKASAGVYCQRTPPIRHPLRAQGAQDALVAVIVRWTRGGPWAMTRWSLRTHHCHRQGQRRNGAGRRGRRASINRPLITSAGQAVAAAGRADTLHCWPSLYYAEGDALRLYMPCCWRWRRPAHGAAFKPASVI